ncbi:MAG: hypothetical protein JWQ43_454 [Glaciihabitans sp.]|nr:hypothetical protein [Glaciihabitans sp.]
MGTDPFQMASESLAKAEGLITGLARPFLALLPISGASVSTFGSLLASETISATDERAGRVDELQFDLGEGPCWDALQNRRPVLEPDLAHTESTPWPAFSHAIQTEEIAAIFAFPLIFGPLEIGAIDLYSLRPVHLSIEQQEQTLALSTIVSRILLRNALKQDDEVEPRTPYSRRLIHQATGMVLAQLGIQSEDAYLIIQARAYAENRSMQDVAKDVLERRLRFADDSGSITEVP